MELPPPQSSSSQTPTPESGHPDQKFRLSCDACAAAKVKCDKVRPRCGRCVGPGMPCVYSVSRKHGKPRPKRQREDPQRTFIRENLIPRVMMNSVHQNLPEPESRKVPAELTPDVRWPTTADSGSDSQMAWDDLSLSPFFHADELPLPPHYSSSGQVSSLETTCVLSTGDCGDIIAYYDVDAPSVGLTPMNFHGFVGSETAHSIETPLSSTPHLSDAQVPLDGPRHKLSRPHSCYMLAQSTLDSLHPRFHQAATEITRNGSSSSTFSSPQSSSSPSIRTPTLVIPTLDHVLRSNKIAISNVLQLLACSCTRDPHLAMLYASIMSKILIWYQVAGGVKNSMSLVPTATCPSPDNGSSLAGTLNPDDLASSAGYRIAHLPISIGEFDLDKEDQEVLGRQLLLSELRKAGHIIHRLATKHFKAGDDIDEGTSNLYSTLGAWLTSELSRTIKEIKKQGSVMA